MAPPMSFRTCGYAQGKLREKSRPAPPKYHLTISITVPTVPGEKRNILVGDEISHFVRNDKV
jgi:hypothetical protein